MDNIRGNQDGRLIWVGGLIRAARNIVLDFHLIVHGAVQGASRFAKKDASAVATGCISRCKMLPRKVIGYLVNLRVF